MIVMGNISGIHNFVCDAAHDDAGQVKRLRARSFFARTFAEAAGLRLLEALGWPIDEQHFPVSAAGRFLLNGPTVDGADEILAREQAAIDRWLLGELSGDIGLSLAWVAGRGLDRDQLLAARRNLNAAGLRPWSSVAIEKSDTSAAWNPAQLVLDPLEVPCCVCRKRKATRVETEAENGQRRDVCSLCHYLLDLGRDLSQARWIVFSRQAGNDDLSAFGLAVRTSQADAVEDRDATIAATNLTRPNESPAAFPRSKLLVRRLSRYVPEGRDGPLTFGEIAQQARGDAMLGVLKADGDGLSAFFDRVIQNASELREYSRAGELFDRFSADALDNEIRKDDRWRMVYTVFSGGDDLLFVGPWDVMVDFALRIRQMFAERFSQFDLTISAGLAVVKPNWPLPRAVVLAEDALHAAKTSPAPAAESAKNQFAGFGMVWKWDQHEAIVAAGRQWADWVDRGLVPRVWLHTLLQLTVAAQQSVEKLTTDQRTERSLAPARMTYFVARNFPPPRVRNPQRAELRRWMDAVAAEIESPRTTHARYFSSILRYAILATRNPEDR